MITVEIVGRIILGAYFLYSGYNHFQNEKALAGYVKSKGVPSARLAVLFTGIMLSVGGLGFILNSHIRESAAILLLFMIPTTFMMHAFWKVSDSMARMGDHVNFFKNIAIIGALLMLL